MEEYAQAPDPDVADWAYMALMESRIASGQTTPDEKQIYISTGLGGKGEKLRFYVLILANELKPFLEYQKKVIEREFPYSLEKAGCEIERLTIGEKYMELVFLIPVRAEDSASLSQKTAELQTELEGINQEMLSISDEIQSIEMQSAIMSGEILRTEEALSSAKANEEQQYEDMKARIKYLYETGNASLLELLFSAESMTDFLNKAEFIQNISDYDREMLESLSAVREDIATKQETLQNQQKALGDLQEG